MLSSEVIIKRAQDMAQELAETLEAEGTCTILISVLYPSQEVYDALQMNESAPSTRGLVVKSYTKDALILSVHNPRNKDK